MRVLASGKNVCHLNVATNEQAWWSLNATRPSPRPGRIQVRTGRAPLSDRPPTRGLFAAERRGLREDV